ncbi:MAG: pyridoxal phosphate-dependent aminotransferase [Lachnospiraceae bacterium]|nr:pyridoxal phosphate-dependent aminotransferase [Lachnospiraceae bacterium]
MAYDFDSVINRRGTGSLKWDIKDDELPMWVADMDFRASDAILEAMQKKIDTGVFGYQILTDEWYDAYISWWKQRHGFEIKRQWLKFVTGVIPAISSAVRTFTRPAEKVVLLTPVYNTFYNSIRNNGRIPYECPLIYDPLAEKQQDRYKIDFEALETALSDPQSALMLLCNPHNPVGRIWTREELSRIGELCGKYEVTVFSDEIHCDLTAPGLSYIPFASVSEPCRDISITAISPSKAFNLAGIQTAAFFAADPRLCHRLWRAVNNDEVGEPSAFAVDAAVAAFTKSGQWLDEARAYIQKNKELTVEYIKNNIPGISVVSTQVTYLLWIDVSKVASLGVNAADFIREKTGLFVCEGQMYGKGGEDFIRLNVACPESLLKEGLLRLKDGIGALAESKS